MSEGQFLWLLLITGGQVISVIVGLASLRRRPPVQEELYKDFATRAEVQQLRAEFLKTAGEVFDVTRQLKESSISLVAQINRLDGVVSRCPGVIDCASNIKRPPRR